MLWINGVTARIATMLVLAASSVSEAQTRAFVFAGLSLKTTMAELKQRYPHSTFVDTLVYVSDKESHDDISTIGLSTDSRLRTLVITFERQRGGRPTYPACENLVAFITNQYGRPANIVDAQEEQARNRRFEWKTSGESLTLNCFRLPQQPLSAERLTIASGP
jgi:hypothetical protein